MSSVRTIIHPVTGQTFKFGRKPSPHRRHLHLKNYLVSPGSLPMPPQVSHYSYAAEAGVAMVLGNDRLGNCTAAAAAHIIDIWRGNARSDEPVVSEEETIRFYSASTGYRPDDDSTDQGGDLITVLSKWKTDGFFGDGKSKLVGYAAVDMTNITEVKAAIWLFENLYVGIGMADAWVEPMPARNGFIWDVAGAPNMSNGHCMAFCGYNEQGVFTLTWGMVGIITPEALAKYFVPSAGGEAYVLLSEEAVNRASRRTPSGANYEDLLRDIEMFPQ